MGGASVFGEARASGSRKGACWRHKADIAVGLMNVRC